MITVDCFLQAPALAYREPWRIMQPGGSLVVACLDLASPLS
jgi:hypothetical protein